MSPRLSLLAVLLVAIACGGSQEPEPAGPDPAQPEPAEPAVVQSPEERDAAKLREAQDVGCEGMCERTTRCAVEDAQANMSEAELAELELEQTAPKHQEECTAECRASTLSVRQVEVLHSCLRDQDSSCQDFVTCLDQLKPQKS